MKILCLTPWFPKHREDQIGNFILDSVESLIALGHEVVILVTQPWKPKVTKIQNKFVDGFNIYSCHYLSIPRSHMLGVSIWFYRKLVNPLLEKLIKQYNCQVIHAHTELPGISAVDIGQKLGIPTVLTMHGISTEKKLYKDKNKKLLFEYTLSKSDRVVLVGKTLLNFSKAFVKNQDHFRIVGNGFRSSENNTITIEKKWLDHTLRFISVSNLVDGKGIDLNLLALAKLKNKGLIKWTYKIVGDGVERKKLELLTHELNLSQHVTFLGACKHNEVYNYLTQSDVFILPSYPEAFGVAYIEAMSCGLLAIGIKNQGPADFIEHEKTGLLIDSNDSYALADILEYIFSAPDKMREIANRGQQHIHNYFTWSSHAKKLTTIYNELV